jgi:PAS domain S-box-containing protein
MSLRTDMSTTRVRDERPAAVGGQRTAPSGSGRAWAWFLGAALAGGLLYFTLPRGSVAQGAVFAALGVAVPVAVGIGIVRNRPVHRRAWLILLAGWAVYQLANVPWALYPLVSAEPLPFPSAADWLYFGAYGLIAAAIFSLIRGRSAGRDRSGIVDALIITAGLGVLAYVFLIRPYVHSSDLPAMARVAAAGYPLVDLLLVAAVTRLALSPGPRSLSFWLLSAGVVFQLVADVGYGLGLLQGTFVPGAPPFFAWAVSYGLIGAAALHPSMARMAEPVPDAERVLTRPRRTVLTMAAIMPAAVLFALELREGDVDGVVGAVMAGLLFVLVQVRLAGLSERLEDTRRARERERARAEELEEVRERLRAAEEQYRSLVEQVPAVVYEAEPGPEGRWTYLSPQIERMLGFAVEEWTSDEALWRRQLHPGDRERTRAFDEEAWRRAQADRDESGTVSAEYRVRHRDGRTVWIRDEGFVIRDERGRPVRWRGLLHDITDVKQANEELARSHSLLEATLEAAGDAIVVIADGVVTGFNRRYLQMWGLTDDIAGRDVDHLRTLLKDRMLDPDGYVERGRRLDEQSEAEATDVLELREGRIIERTSKPQRVGERVVGRVWSFRDVTEQRRTQLMLAEAQRVGRLGSWEWNALTDVTIWSDELYRLYGMEPGSFEPKLETWLDRLHPEDRERIRSENDRAVAIGGPMEMEFRVVLPGGQVRDHRAEVEMTLDDHGRPLRMIGIEYDVTDLKRAQADLNRTIKALRETDAQRRRLLARLVEVQEGERSRIAADFHDDTIQVMTAVGMRLEALRTRLQDEEDRARVQSLEEGVTHAVARLRNLLFELRPRALDREGLVAAIRVYLSRGGKHDEASYQIDSELLEEPPLETRVVLYRAAQEALANARKHAQASKVRIELRQPNDGYLVRIIDDGRGFTPTGEGEPGHLGIVAMRDRVEMAGGWLRIDSAERKGTTVEFWVPGPQALQAGAGA